MNTNIISLINFYKLDIYAGLSSKDHIIQLIERKIPGVSTDSGQKRIVVYNPQEPNYVYKIAFNEAGILDNINEVATSNKLRDLANQGILSPNELSLFALATLLENADPVIIRQEIVTHYTQDSDYMNWLRSSPIINDYRITNSINEHQCFPLYISHINDYREQYNRIVEIMSQFFIPSDISVMREPKNFGIKNYNGRKNICLLDMGSVVPILQDDMGNQILPTYGATNQPMMYVATKMTGPANISDMLVTNPGRYVPVGNNLANVDDYCVLDIDDAVFHRYITFQCPHEYNKLLAIHGCWFMATSTYDSTNGQFIKLPTNVNDFTNLLYYATGIQFPANIIMTMWNNYIYKRSAMYLLNSPDIMNLGVTDNINGTATLVSFNDFHSAIVQKFNTLGFNLELNITSTIAGIVYLQNIIKTLQLNDDTLYNLTSSGPDEFVNLLSQIVQVTPEEAYTIYNASTGMIY